MIDTVKFQIKVDNPSKVRERLGEYKILADSEEAGVIKYLSYPRDERISIKDDILRVELSLINLIAKENVHYLTRKATEITIRKRLRERFGVDLSKAEVKRLDIGLSFFMKEKPYRYFNLLLDSKKIPNKMIFENESLTFLSKTKNKSVLFYDKQIHYKNRKKVPTEFKLKNILRFEVQLLKNPAHQLKVNLITMDMLYNPEFCKKLIKFWKNEYENVVQSSNVKYNNLQISDQNSLKETLYQIALHENSYELFQKLFVFEGNYKATNKWRVKEKIRKDLMNENLSRTNPLIKELNSKVNKRYNKIIDDLTWKSIDG